MRNPLLVPDLRELLHAGETAPLREFLEEYHPARVAEVIEDLGPGEGDATFALLEPRHRAEVMSYIDGETQVRLVEAMKPADAAAMLHLMSHDERADLVNRLDDDRADAILRGLAHAEREDIRRLASYEPGTAGAVMTTDYATLPPDLTVREAIDRLTREAPDRETIYYSYAVDAHRKLLGLVSLKTLLLSPRRARVDDVMTREVISARLDEDQESVARKIQEYDLLAIPVIDAHDMLVGIVTHDDAMDILRQEQTEDILRFGGVAVDREADDAPYWQGRVLDSVRRRIVPLMLLFFAEFLTGWVLRAFQWVNDRSITRDLPLFVPMLIGTGGNAGSQTVGTIIRGLALGEILPRHALKVVSRELATGLVLGLALGALGFLYAMTIRGQSPRFAAVIGATLVGICMWANTIGALVPLVAKRLKKDPAVISAPLITTLVDASGLFIYYTVAILVLLKLGI